eukprot:COSAG02_NODE_11690_length_1673_cov_1.735705_2_plen_64_part_01
MITCLRYASRYDGDCTDPTRQSTDGYTAVNSRYFEASTLAEDLGLSLSGPALNAAIPKLDPGRS